MGPRHRHQLELVVLAVTVIGLSRLLDGPLIWPVAGLLLAAVWLGGRAVLFDGAIRPAPGPARGHDHPRGRRPPARLGSLRLVPLGLALVPALLGAGLLARPRAPARDAGLRPTGRHDPGRSHVAARHGARGLVPRVPRGREHGERRDRRAGPGSTELGPPITETGIVAIALADAFVAGLLGYRFAIERLAGMGDAIWAAGTYAASIAIAAGILRAVATPRLLSRRC